MITIQNMKTPGKIFALVICALIAVPVYSAPIADTYSAGDTLTAAKMDNIKSAVNDNDTRTTTNTADVATNTADIATNTADVATNTADIATNTADIATNTADVATNTADVATNTADIAALQASACPSDMVASGTLCVDKFEASVWNAATAGTQISGAASAIYNTCSDTGSAGSNTNAVAVDCTNTIYARSVTGVAPAYDITQYQAAIACANVGKRLPTVSEWLIAAVGTTTGNGTVAADCNNVGGGGSLRNTSSPANCVSDAGAYDMIGNVWELTSDVDFGALANGVTGTTTAAKAVALGGDYLDLGATATRLDTFILPLTDNLNTTLGFRCVKDK